MILAPWILDTCPPESQLAIETPGADAANLVLINGDATAGKNDIVSAGIAALGVQTKTGSRGKGVLRPQTLLATVTAIAHTEIEQANHAKLSLSALDRTLNREPTSLLANEA